MYNRKQKLGIKRGIALLLSLALLLTACGSNTTAATMRLIRAEGQVNVSNNAGAEVTLQENLGLYSGYEVDTRQESFAWINLDNVKLTKMDQESEIAIQKEGKKLEIEVRSGSLFFNVTEPLTDDETMDIRTSTMAVGIRGTCGWVTQDTVALLEGTVEVTAGEQSVTITTGEMVVLTADGKLEVKKLSARDIPAFVEEEVRDDEELLAAVGEGSGGASQPGPELIPWANAGLTDHVMDWRDEALAAAMAELTGISGDIMLSDVWELQSLALAELGISDISALGELTNLTKLNLNQNNINDISALGGLTNLTELWLDYNSISDISALSDLTNLTELRLGYNNISDISALRGLINLISLSLQDNNISEISALGDLTNVIMLDLRRNNISDISALSEMRDLTYLYLDSNNISDISALSGLTNLDYLSIGGNNISDWSPVEFVEGLTIIK